jgi:hypothetical protein
MIDRLDQIVNQIAHFGAVLFWFHLSLPCMADEREDLRVGRGRSVIPLGKGIHSPEAVGKGSLLQLEATSAKKLP